MNTGDQTNAGGDQSYRVSITPTWESVARMSIEALLNGTNTGEALAREEIIDLGIKLDDAKEILEKKKDLNLIPLQALRDAVDDKNKTILDQNERALEMERQLNKQALALANYQKQADKDLEYIQELEKNIEEKNLDLLVRAQHNEIYKEGQDTSIDEQVANYQPHREGDE